MSEVHPTVSVIVPCYKQAKYLSECIESVLAQDFNDYEIIVVDDGNTDPTELDVLESLNYPKTRILHKANGGVASARNFGISNACGKYILPLDADDRISSNFMGICVSVLEADGTVGIVGGKCEMFGARQGDLILPPYSFPYVLVANMLTVTQMYRRSDWEAAHGYKENMIYGYEDWDFWLSIIGAGRKVICCKNIVYYYRQSPASRSGKLESCEDYRRASLMQIVDNHADLYTRYPRHRAYLLTGTYSFSGVLARVIARLLDCFNLSPLSWKLRRIV